MQFGKLCLNILEKEYFTITNIDGIASILDDFTSPAGRHASLSGGLLSVPKCSITSFEPFTYFTRTVQYFEVNEGIEEQKLL